MEELELIYVDLVIAEDGELNGVEGHPLFKRLDSPFTVNIVALLGFQV